MISIVRRGSATASVRTSRMGCRFVALFRGATAGTAAQIEAVTREGLPVVRTITYRPHERRLREGRVNRRLWFAAAPW